MDKSAPAYSETFCSQCGKAFGPGNSGYSHCSDHYRDSGIDAAAQFIKQRHDVYYRDYGKYDPDTGFTEFSNAGDEYLAELIYLEESIRLLKTRA